MNTLKLVAVAGLLCVLSPGGGPAIHGASPAAVLGILQTELQRNYQILRKEPVPAYFIGYTVHEQRATNLAASNGALQRSDEVRTRFGTVEVRVGDYGLDNTHPIRGDAGVTSPRISRVTLPLTDEEQPIRLALWRATDRTFKQASEALTRVKTNVASKIREEDPAPDFSREEPQTFTGTPAAYTLDTAQWEARLRRISAPFADDPLVFRSEVTLSVTSHNRYLTTSEGTQVATGEVSYRLFIQAMTKADDGMELPLYASYFARSPEGLPDEKELIADAREMMALLARLRLAPLVDPFSGPAVLSGRAAGVFFHEIFGHRVEGHRQRNVNDAQTFAKSVNGPVLPLFLSVAFDPTIRKRGDTELMGHYQYDDEGVKARRVTVVDKGILKTFLLDRAPVRTMVQSNGHGRAEPGFATVSRQSNLIVESSRTVSDEALMTLLKDEARKQGKAFGLLFDNIEGGFTTTSRGAANSFNVLPNVVYRVYADSRPPELVRGVDLIGTPLAAFGKILATGDKSQVFNGTCGAESGGVPVSASSPALLVAEVEVQKKAQSQEALPILPSPPRVRKS
jgi:predicted Zn-dependent protease